MFLLLALLLLNSEIFKNGEESLCAINVFKVADQSLLALVLDACVPRHVRKTDLTRKSH